MRVCVCVIFILFLFSFCQFHTYIVHLRSLAWQCCLWISYAVFSFSSHSLSRWSMYVSVTRYALVVFASFSYQLHVEMNFVVVFIHVFSPHSSTVAVIIVVGGIYFCHNIFCFACNSSSKTYQRHTCFHYIE